MNNISAEGRRALAITVAICTFKRVALLRDTLRSVLQQQMNSTVTWEIVVVDNDPLSSAERTVTDAAATTTISVRYVSELRVGLSHARNRALLEARGHIVAFLDDDVVVTPHWMVEILGTFERTGADCVGGRVLVQWDDSPEAAVRECQDELVAFDKGNRDFEFKGRQVPIGANLAIKVTALDGDALFDSMFGRTAHELLGSEEVELLYRLMRRKKRIWYSARAVILHRMATPRTTQAYYLEREAWNGRSLAFIDTRQKPALYCQAKASARIIQLFICLYPRYVWAHIVNKAGTKCIVSCARCKYRAYSSGVMRILWTGYWNRILHISERGTTSTHSLQKEDNTTCTLRSRL